jgi:putative endonuclease
MDGRFPQMSNYRQVFGKWGEEFAAQYLISRGYKILAKNVRTPYGEIDLVAMQQTAVDGIDTAPVIVFVEVKTRSSTAFGFPEASINSKKQEHILAAAQYYLVKNPNLDGDWRVDVIAIQRHSRSEPPSVEHFENVFTA